MLDKQVGCAVYPSVLSIEECRERVDQAAALGYKVLFTISGDGSLDSTCLSAKHDALFEYAYQKGMELHLDVNDRVMKELKATADNLKPFYDRHIPVIRVDCGCTLEEIVAMTRNPYGIIIEENLSNLKTLRQKMEAVNSRGNMKQYGACHNFYPRPNSGLTLPYALQCAKIAKSYGCRTGAFICSQTAAYELGGLNIYGKGLPTVEKHRYLPAHIQAMELFAAECFDFLIMADVRPASSELIEVAKTTRSAYDCLSEDQKAQLSETAAEEYKETYCISLPVYLEKRFEYREEIQRQVMKNRTDVSEEAIRIMNYRGKARQDPMNTVWRSKYSITMDNKRIPAYAGEVEILLKAMPAVEYANVIGAVKPVGYDLIDLIKDGKVMFQLSEE